MKETVFSFFKNLAYFGTAFIAATLYAFLILLSVAVIQPLLAPVREWLDQWGLLPLFLLIALIMAVLMAFIQTVSERVGRWYE